MDYQSDIMMLLQARLDRPLSGEEVAYIGTIKSFMMLEVLERTIILSSKESLEAELKALLSN